MQNRIRSSLGLGCAVYLLSSCMLMLLPLEGCQNLFLAAGYSLQSSVKCDGFWCCGVSCFCFVIGIGFSTFGIICDLQISDLTSAWNPIFLAFLYDKPCPFAVFTFVFQSYLQFHCFYFFFFLGLILFLSFLCIIMFSLKPPLLSATAVTPPVWLSLQLPHVYVGSTFSPLSPGQEVCVLPAPRQAHGGTQEVPVPPHVWCVCWTVIAYCCASRKVSYAGVKSYLDWKFGWKPKLVFWK